MAVSVAINLRVQRRSHYASDIGDMSADVGAIQRMTFNEAAQTRTYDEHVIIIKGGGIYIARQICQQNTGTCIQVGLIRKL